MEFILVLILSVTPFFLFNPFLSLLTFPTPLSLPLSHSPSPRFSICRDDREPVAAGAPEQRL